MTSAIMGLVAAMMPKKTQASAWGGAWDPTVGVAHNSKITTGNGNLTVQTTEIGTPYYRSLRGTVGYSSGRRAYRTTITSLSAATNVVVVGIGQASIDCSPAAAHVYPGQANTVSVGYLGYNTAGYIYFNNTNLGAVAGINNGDVIDFVLDLTGMPKIEVWKNNTLLFSGAVALSAGVYYPMQAQYDTGLDPVTTSDFTTVFRV